MTAPTPLWLCLKIDSNKEQRAHERMVDSGFHSLRLVRHVRVIRKGKREWLQRTLMPAYGFVAHDGQPDFIERLLRLQWPAGDRTFQAIRGDKPGDIADIVRRQFAPIDSPVVKHIWGHVPNNQLQHLIDMSETPPADDTPTPTLLKPGDKARILLAGDIREVELTVIKGRKARILIDGREVSTTLDKLEAA